MGTGAGAGGSLLSKRSRETFLAVVVGFGGADGSEAKLKSPKSFESRGDAFGRMGCGAFDAVGGFAVGLGPGSKKPPPFSGGDVT